MPFLNVMCSVVVMIKTNLVGDVSCLNLAEGLLKFVDERTTQN